VIWRSTLLNLASRHCARALDFAEAGAPYEREHFAVGVSAHAIIEEVGKAAAERKRYLTNAEVEDLAQATAESLIREGRDFEGQREPPLRSDLVWRGRDLALAYARECPLAPDGKYEQAAAVTKNFLPCPVGEGAWLMARIDFYATRVAGLDLMADDDEEEVSGPVLVVDDFKSAWTADEDELDTLQRKIQAVVAWANFGEWHEVLRIRIVNLRLRRIFERVIFPNTEEGAALMARWRRDIASEVKARDVQKGPDGRRPATPGAGCYGCPYLLQCDDAKQWMDATGREGRGTLGQAIGFAVLEAERKQLISDLKAATEIEPIHLPVRGSANGFVHGDFVGFAPEEKRVPSDTAPGVLAGLWARRMHGRDAEGILAALPGLLASLKLGKAQLEAGLSHLYPGKGEERERKYRALNSMLATKITRSFGVHRADEKGASDE
jgi:hypothetical protein